MHPDAQEGLQKFNQRKYYAAHEYFERAWRERKNDSREFYRALLQVSGGFYRLTQGRPGAAIKFFNRSLHWLEFFPKHYQGINTDELRNQLEELIKATNENRDTVNILENFLPKIKGVFEEKKR